MGAVAHLLAGEARSWGWCQTTSKQNWFLKSGFRAQSSQSSFQIIGRKAPVPDTVGYGVWSVLRSMRTSPYPAVTGKLAARAQPVSASASASAGRGPGASEGRAGPEPGAGSGEQGRKRISPAHSGPPVGTQRQSTLMAGLLWNLKLPCCWGAGNFLWNLVSQTTKPQGFGSLLEASCGKTLPRTQGPVVGAS